jgi:phage terminase small subunit
MQTLTFRQERFVFEYLKDQNASAAAARAGYTARNMASQGNELMSNPAIAERVRLEMQSILAELRCSALELMKQRMRAVFFDPGKLLKGWEPIPLEELDAETRAVLDISTVTRKSGPVVRVKQADRHKALRALERVHEQMEKLNERYYARLEREGKLMSLEEIEAMDGGESDANAQARAEASADEILEKDQVLSGSAPGAGTQGCEFFEKAQVLSGSAGKPAEPPSAISAIHQVLSGSPWPAKLAQLPPHTRGRVAEAVSTAFHPGGAEQARPRMQERACRTLLAA